MQELGSAQMYMSSSLIIKSLSNCAGFQTMAELNLAAKLKNQLKQEKIHLWNPPYTDEQYQAGQQHMQVGRGRDDPTKPFNLLIPIHLCDGVLRSWRSAIPRYWPCSCRT